MRSDLTHVHQASITPLVDVKRPEWFDDDSEWEYEYDVEETQDIFFTLDLTTHVPDTIKKREFAKNGKWARGTLDARTKKEPVLKRKAGRPTNALAEDPDAIFEEQASPANEQSEYQDVDEDSDQEDATTASTSSDVVQFVGLHTASPYVVFNDQFFSAYWLSDLGTQLWISRPDVSESTIYKGYVMDIIGASQIRLLAKPAKHQPRLAAELAQEAITPAPRRDRGRTEPSSTTLGPLVVPKIHITDQVSRAHANFMERFAALKWSRGEKDQMPLQSVRYYEYPKNAQEIRDAAITLTDAPNKRLRLDDGTYVSTSPHQKSVDLSKRAERPPRKERAKARKKTQDSENDDNEDDDSDEESAQATPARRIRKPDERRGPRVRKLVALGLQAPNAPKPPRRKRRTKAEMEEARRLGLK